MRPPLTELGGSQNFEDYRTLFDSVYKTNPIIDVLGNTVVFGDSHVNGPYDCHHVCYGGAKADWGNPAKWEQERAERILWIGPALTDLGIKVYQDPGFPNRRRYLLVVDAEPSQNRPTEYFCVIAESIGAKRMAFITAYNITREKWEEYKRVPPRYYPLPKPNEAISKKKKKKGAV